VRLDALVLLCSFIWGCNYAVVKVALREIPDFGFNALRLALASLLFLGVLAFTGDDAGPGRAGRRLFASARRVAARDWWLLLGLGAAGHCLYQICFIGGLARTSVANSALLLGCSPVAVTALTLAVGHERVSWRYWPGAALSLVGIYLVVGAGSALSGESLAGDLLTGAGVLCWAVYAVGSRTAMRRHSPLVVTGYSMALGTLLYLPFGLPALAHLDWAGVSAGAWAALISSAVFALFVAYLIWYTSIQRVGNVRTALYANLNPIIALVAAVVFLGDRLSAREVAGAAMIVVGVAVARSSPGEGSRQAGQ
jgi:drug/metabolite transporter (DMT)-like permease